MESKTREQEAMNPMNIPMSNPPYTDMRGFPYYAPDLQNLNNYHQMGYYNGYQQMNGYSHPMDLYQDDSQLNPLNNQENKSTPKNQTNSAINPEKPKAKPYINFLINAVTNLLNEGKITMKYLKEKTEHKNSNGINGYEYSSLSSIQTVGTSTKSNNTKQNSLYESKNSSNNFSKKSGNMTENVHCENPLCKYSLNSNKDRIKIKIKGLKTQEKKLCKRCCEAVEKGHFCYYCNAIYRDDMTDTAKWVECDFCKKWEHFDCEISKGRRYSTTQELNDVKQYMCPICVNERAEQKNLDNKIQKKLINKKRRSDAFDDQKCKKNQRKDLRNLKSEKCSELLADIQQIDSFRKYK